MFFFFFFVVIIFYVGPLFFFLFLHFPDCMLCKCTCICKKKIFYGGVGGEKKKLKKKKKKKKKDVCLMGLSSFRCFLFDISLWGKLLALSKNPPTTKTEISDIGHFTCRLYFFFFSFPPPFFPFFFFSF